MKIVRYKCEKCGAVEDIVVRKNTTIHPPLCHRCQREMIEIDVMLKVRVYVRMVMDIPYIVEIHREDSSWNGRIRKTLEQKDPSDWELDPDFYEYLGSNWHDLIVKTKNFQHETLDSTT